MNPENDAPIDCLLNKYPIYCKAKEMAFSMLTYHNSTLPSDVDALKYQPIECCYLGVNANLLDFTRMTSCHQNIYESYLEHGLTDDASSPQLFRQAITVLVTRHCDSDSGVKKNDPSRMLAQGAKSSNNKDDERFPIAKALDPKFVAHRTKEIFGEGSLREVDLKDINELIQNLIRHINEAASGLSSPDAMMEFINNRMLPCIDKIKSGEDSSGVTTEFWGYEGGVPIVHRDKSPKVLTAFISENFCRMLGIVLHPINGQTRMMVFRYLSRGVDPYLCVKQNSEDSECRSTKYFDRQSSLKNENLMVLYPLINGQEINKQLLEQCKARSVKLGDQSRLAQDHGPLTNLKMVVDGLEKKMKAEGTKFPFYTDGIRALLSGAQDSVNTEDGAVPNAVREVSDLFGAHHLPRTEDGVVITFCNAYEAEMAKKKTVAGYRDPNLHCLRDQSHCYGVFWAEKVYEFIRKGLVESNFHTNSTISAVSPQRTEIYQDKNKFSDRMKKFSRSKDPLQHPLFIFPHVEHNTLQHLFRRMLLGGNDVIMFKSCGDFDSLDYVAFQMLLIALYDKKSLETFKRFCKNEKPTHDQKFARGGTEADKILMTTAAVMTSTCSRPFSTHIRRVSAWTGLLMKSIDIQTALHYTLAAEVAEDVLPALKKLGKSPILPDGSFLKELMWSPFQEDTIKGFIKIPDNNLKTLMDEMELGEDQVTSRLNIDAVVERMKKEWKSDCGFFSTLAVSYIAYVTFLSEIQFTVTEKSEVKQPNKFLRQCLKIWQDFSFLQGGDDGTDWMGGICNWDGLAGSFVLQPSKFIERSCEELTDGWEVSVTPMELIGPWKELHDPSYVLRNFDHDYVCEQLVLAWLKDKTDKWTPKKLEEFYFGKTDEKEEEPSDINSLRERFVKMVGPFRDMLKRKFEPAAPFRTQNARKKKSMFNDVFGFDNEDAALSDHEKDRIAEVVNNINDTIYTNLRPGEHPLDNNVSYTEEYGLVTEAGADDEMESEEERYHDPRGFIHYEAVEANEEEEEEQDEEEESEEEG